MEVVAVFIPIIAIVTTGIVIVSFVYFNFREKQMIIEKGFSAEEIKLLIGKKRKSSFTLLGLGIVSVFFGIGVSLGIMLDEVYHADFLIPFCIFTLTGIGMVIAHKEREKYLEKHKNENES